LAERGQAITENDEKLRKEVDKKINKYLVSSKGKKETKQIISAFITFRTEEGHDEAQNYIKI
jgi:hypothetical protein